MLFSIFLCGCSRKENINDYYISYTLTKQVGEDLKSEVHYYDLADGTDKIITELPYTAQYPLTVYDKVKEKVYYTSKVKNCDQVFEYDIKTKNHKQLTDSLSAINYIIPYEDTLLIIAVPKGSNMITLQPFLYKDNTLTDIAWDKDFNVSTLFYDLQSSDFILSGYSSSEDWRRIENQDKKEYIAPPNYIYHLEKDGKQKSKIYETNNGNINSIAANEDYIYTTNDINEDIVKIDKRKGELSETIEVPSYRLFYVTNDELMYYYSNDEIYTYDLNSKKKTILCTIKTETSAINNAIVLKK